MISTRLVGLAAMVLVGSCQSVNSDTAPSAEAAPSPKIISRLTSLANIATALTSVIGSITTLFSAIDELVTTGSETIDRASAKALVGRLNRLSAATSRTMITQTYVMGSMDNYAAAWEPDTPQLNSFKRAQLEIGWANVKSKVIEARAAVADLDKMLAKESGEFGRDPAYQELYTAVAARRELLSSLDLDGPSILAASEVEALRKVAKAYANLHATLMPAIDKLNTYISNLESKRTKGSAVIPKVNTAPGV